ncbi:hypothetical protein BDZ97DRAFT_1866660 [Flammula alnicola]|nr:hypothetical protein BDZ97DRAFT_1866660 [Flammula alnicola]
MSSEPQNLRPPKVAYAGRNGFLRGFTEPEEINDQNIQSALEGHRRALFVMNQKKRAVPDFETMKAEAEKPDDLDSVKERLKTLQEEHLEDLRRLYAYHALDYEQEVEDRYLLNDESWFSEDKINDTSNARLQEILSSPLADVSLEAEWQNDYEQLRYTYLFQLIPLEKRHRDLELAQEQERKRRERMFPDSKEDFEKKAKEVQLRAARFLVASAPEKEKMLAIYDWAWRQVQPLQEIFKKDEVFAADVRGMVLAHTSVSDPRRAPRA